MRLFNYLGKKLPEADDMQDLGKQNTAGKLFGGIQSLGSMGPLDEIASSILGPTLPEALFGLLGKKKKEEEM